jgi:3-oxoacyl-[acyl-carrier-protein] synthase III
MRNLKIIGVGVYLPTQYVKSEDLDQKFGLEKGTVEKTTKVKSRYYIENETNSFMAKKAIEDVLEKSKLTINDIDCIIDASGTFEQPIPSGGSLIAKELGIEEISTIDIDNTCIGFITALDLASCYFVANKYKRIIIVTSEIASVGLDYTHIQSASLFGDGATATIVENDQSSYVLGSVFKTYSKGTSYTEIRGGGAKMHPKYYGEGTLKDFSFQMNGEDVYKLTRKYAPKIQNQILEESKCTLENINCIIPHQASPTGIDLMSKFLKWEKEDVINIVKEYGNMISSSIPLALHIAINDNKVKRGDNIYFIGTAAGLIIGGLILKY